MYIPGMRLWLCDILQPKRRWNPTCTCNCKNCLHSMIQQAPRLFIEAAASTFNLSDYLTFTLLSRRPRYFLVQSRPRLIRITTFTAISSDYGSFYCGGLCLN